MLAIELILLAWEPTPYMAIYVLALELTAYDLSIQVNIIVYWCVSLGANMLKLRFYFHEAVLLKETSSRTRIGSHLPRLAGLRENRQKTQTQKD